MIKKRQFLQVMKCSVLFFVAYFLVGFIGAKSQLDHIIAPEIKNDAFYQKIYQLARSEKLSTILKIGSSSGEGSTEAFVSGIRENPHHPTLYYVEISKRRFSKLKKHYKKDTFVRCYNVSSVPLEDFPQENEVAHFFLTTQLKHNETPLPQILAWLKQDIEYLKCSKVPQKGK